MLFSILIYIFVLFFNCVCSDAACTTCTIFVLTGRINKGGLGVCVCVFQVVRSSSDRCRVLLLSMVHQRTGPSALPGLRAFPRLSTGTERALVIVGSRLDGDSGGASAETPPNFIAVSLQRPAQPSVERHFLATVLINIMYCGNQWSFRRTGTVGTMTSRANLVSMSKLSIGSLAPRARVWVAPSRCRSPGASPPETFRDCTKSRNLVHFGWKMVHNAVHNAFLNTLTTGTAFPRVLNDPGAYTLKNHPTLGLIDLLLSLCSVNTHTLICRLLS